MSWIVSAWIETVEAWRFTFIKESTRAFPSSKGFSVPTVPSSPTLLFISGMRMICPESQTLPQQARFWPSSSSLPWLPLLLFFPWKMLHSSADGRHTLEAAGCIANIFHSWKLTEATRVDHGVEKKLKPTKSRKRENQSNKERKKSNKLMWCLSKVLI